MKNINEEDDIESNDFVENGEINDTGSKVIIENGEIKTIYSEEIKNNGGWMSVDEFARLMDEWKNKMIEVYWNENNNG